MNGGIMKALPWTRIAGLLSPHDSEADQVRVVMRGFRGEDALRGYIRQCAADTERVMAMTGRWQVFVRRRQGLHDVSIRLTTGRATAHVTHQDPQEYAAVGGAFARIREAYAKESQPSPESMIGCPWSACSRI